MVNVGQSTYRASEGLGGLTGPLQGIRVFLHRFRHPNGQKRLNSDSPRKGQAPALDGGPPMGPFGGAGLILPPIKGQTTAPPWEGGQSMRFNGRGIG